jgi:hypothetical protein
MANVLLKTARGAELDIPPANASKDGYHYDQCPNPDCGARDIEPFFKIGGGEGSGEHQHAALYVHDRRKGGCGMNWHRTTREGLEKDHARGKTPKWVTGSVQRGRSGYWSIPGDAYERIFGHKEGE